MGTLLRVAAALSCLLEPGWAGSGITLLCEDAFGALHCPVRGVRVSHAGRRGVKLFFVLWSGLVETAGRGLRSGWGRGQRGFNGPGSRGARKMRMVEADCGGRTGCSRRREIVSVREGGFRRRRQWRSYGRSGAGRHPHGQSNPLGCDRLHLWRQSAARKRQRRRSWSMEQLRAGRLEGDKSRREKERNEQKKITKEIQNQAKVKRERASGERSRSVTTRRSFLWMVCCVGERAVHSYPSHRVQPISVLLRPFSSLGQDPRHKTSCGLWLHTVSPKSLREQLKPPSWWQNAAFDWLGSNSWGPSNSHCGSSQNSLLQWTLTLSNSSISNACSSGNMHCRSCTGERDQKSQMWLFALQVTKTGPVFVRAEHTTKSCP